MLTGVHEARLIIPQIAGKPTNPQLNPATTKYQKNHPGSSLDKIVQRAQQMDSLTTTLQASLPADVAENLIAANISDEDELVLVCRSSAWASRLRFESESMLEAARNAGESPTRCRVRVCR